MNVQWQNLARVGVGAGLGAVARYLMPGPLLLINVLGCLAFGLSKPGLFWRTGFLGGFTSFSAYILLGHTHFEAGRFTETAWVVFGHALACVAAVLAGRFLSGGSKGHLIQAAHT